MPHSCLDDHRNRTVDTWVIQDDSEVHGYLNRCVCVYEHSVSPFLFPRAKTMSLDGSSERGEEEEDVLQTQEHSRILNAESVVEARQLLLIHQVSRSLRIFIFFILFFKFTPTKPFPKPINQK